MFLYFLCTVCVGSMIICERIIISHSAFLNEIFLYCKTKRAAENRTFFKMAGYLYETQAEKKCYVITWHHGDRRRTPTVHN